MYQNPNQQFDSIKLTERMHPWCRGEKKILHNLPTISATIL